MRQYMAGTAMRFFFFFAGSVMWTGIWLTGFVNAHWLLYLPAALLYFAALTGICPVWIVSRILFDDRRMR